jgi:hypothetical protein
VNDILIGRYTAAVEFRPHSNSRHGTVGPVPRPIGRVPGNPAGRQVLPGLPDRIFDGKR